MEGLAELSEEILHMPVRVGLPHTVTGLVDVVRNPIYATGVGLLTFGHRNTGQRSPESMSNGGIKALWERMGGWFQGNF